jgi:methionyl-tRNA formyltransferase
MRLVFAGTPQAAVPSLEALLHSRHSVVAVLTRPDAPAGRGLRLAASPVAQRARAAGIEVLQPGRPADPDFLARLSEIGPDCCPVTGYGALIPRPVLSVPRHGWVNLHFSLLPAWRGAAPVQHAILHGDEITGATTFRLVADLDAGPVYGMLTEPVRPSDTAGDLLGRLSAAGAGLLVATLDGIESGDLAARPQPPDGISLAPKLRRDDARVDWKLTAQAVDRLVRACSPVPGAWTLCNGSVLKIGPVERTPDPDPGSGLGSGEGTADQGAGSGLGPGELRVTGSRVIVGTGTAAVQLGEVQPEGKRRMAAADWARGLRTSVTQLVLGW